MRKVTAAAVGALMFHRHMFQLLRSFSRNWIAGKREPTYFRFLLETQQRKHIRHTHTNTEEKIDAFQCNFANAHSVIVGNESCVEKALLTRFKIIYHFYCYFCRLYQTIQAVTIAFFFLYILVQSWVFRLKLFLANKNSLAFLLSCIPIEIVRYSFCAVAVVGQLGGGERWR